MMMQYYHCHRQRKVFRKVFFTVSVNFKPYQRSLLTALIWSNVGDNAESLPKFCIWLSAVKDGTDADLTLSSTALMLYQSRLQHPFGTYFSEYIFNLKNVQKVILISKSGVILRRSMKKGSQKILYSCPFKWDLYCTYCMYSTTEYVHAGQQCCYVSTV